MKPTARQLAYLKALAARTGTTLRHPNTRAEASREIQRLKQRTPDSAAHHRRERNEITADLTQAATDAVRHTPDKTRGHGATARWAHHNHPQPTGHRATPPNPQPGGARELARYVISAGERVIRGERIHGKVALSDAPVNFPGRVHLIERHVTSQAEMDAIIADYIRTSTRQDAPAAARHR